MPIIKNSEREAIGTWFNTISAAASESIEKFSNAMLAIFTPATSGLLVLSTTLSFHSMYQRYLFAAIVTLSGLIVLVALAEKYIHTLIKNHIYKQFVDHLNETGKLLSKPIGGKAFHANVLKNLSSIMFAFLICDILAILLFTYSYIF